MPHVQEWQIHYDAIEKSLRLGSQTTTRLRNYANLSDEQYQKLRSR